jgi:hypothetical protein
MSLVIFSFCNFSFINFYNFISSTYFITWFNKLFILNVFSENLLYLLTVFLSICKLEDIKDEGAFPKNKYNMCNWIFNGNLNLLNIVPFNGDIAFLHL